MSLRKRIQILLCFLVGIPLLILLVESYRAGRHAMLGQIRTEATHIARLQAAELDQVFAPPQVMAEGLARTVEALPALGEEDLTRLLRATLQQSPSLYGMSIAMVPGETPLDRCAPYVFRGPAGLQAKSLATGDYAYTDKDWFREPVLRGRGGWTRPYFDRGGGEAAMVSYATPIRRDGKTVGVAEVDLSLDELVTRLRQLRPGDDGLVYLVSADGQVLARPQGAPSLAGEAHLDMNALEALVRKTGMDAVEARDPFSRRRSWIVEAPLASQAPDRGGQGWSVIVSWPLGQRRSPLTTLGKRMLFLYLVLGGGSLLFLNRSFHDVITRPLRRLSDQARRFAEGDYAHRVSVHQEARELQELGQALERLGERLGRASAAGVPAAAAPEARPGPDTRSAPAGDPGAELRSAPHDAPAPPAPKEDA